MTGEALPRDELGKQSADTIAAHVHGVLKAILGQALKYVERHAEATKAVSADSAGDGQYAGIVVSSQRSESPLETLGGSAGRPTQGQAEQEGAHFRQNVGGRVAMEPPNEDAVFNNDSEEQISKARSLLQVLRIESRMSRAKYTSLYYLEELGDKHACDGVVINMKDLTGENKETTRERILDLCAKKAVRKDPTSSRLQKIALTALGKVAYDLLRFPDASVISRKSPAE
jgi:hypothetical protein